MAAKSGSQPHVAGLLNHVINPSTHSAVRAQVVTPCTRQLDCPVHGGGSGDTAYRDVTNKLSGVAASDEHGAEPEADGRPRRKD
jgi:hypothetical protein